MIARFARPTILLLKSFASHLLGAQTITIKLVNGETGKPMTNYNVTLHWDNLKSTVVFIGPSGRAQVEIKPESKGFVLSEGPKFGKEPDRVAYVNCSRGPTSQLAVQEVVTIGIVPENLCGSKTQKPKPGEVIFWARPHHFRELDFQ